MEEVRIIIFKVPEIKQKTHFLIDHDHCLDVQKGQSYSIFKHPTSERMGCSVPKQIDFHMVASQGSNIVKCFSALVWI